MPFKSKAQRRKFAELLVKGEISPETYEEWNRETGRAKLPEYVGSRTTRKGKREQLASASGEQQPRGRRADPRAVERDVRAPLLACVNPRDGARASARGGAGRLATQRGECCTSPSPGRCHPAARHDAGARHPSWLPALRWPAVNES